VRLLFLPAGSTVRTSVEHFMRQFLVSASSKSDIRNNVEWSHTSLLLGCAGPVWLFASLISNRHTDCASGIANPGAFAGAIEVAICLLPFAGLLTLGVGDAAAAVVGKLYGRYRWCTVACYADGSSSGGGGSSSGNCISISGGSGSKDRYSGSGSGSGSGGNSSSSGGRTVEGSVACFVTMFLSSLCLLLFWQRQGQGQGKLPCSTLSKTLFACLFEVTGTWTGTGTVETVAGTMRPTVGGNLGPELFPLLSLLPWLACGLLLVTAVEAVTCENDNVQLPLYWCTLLLCYVCFV
jgi:hypothetical protein